MYNYLRTLNLNKTFKDAVIDVNNGVATSFIASDDSCLAAKVVEDVDINDGTYALTELDSVLKAYGIGNSTNTRVTDTNIIIKSASTTIRIPLVEPDTVASAIDDEDKEKLQSGTDNLIEGVKVNNEKKEEVLAVLDAVGSEYISFKCINGAFMLASPQTQRTSYSVMLAEETAVEDFSATVSLKAFQNVLKTVELEVGEFTIDAGRGAAAVVLNYLESSWYLAGVANV